MKKFDLHIHSNASKCSNTPPHKILQAAQKKKLDGIAITDHDTIAGGLAIKKLNKNKDFEVIVGAEIRTKKCDVLGYYLNTEIKSRELQEVIDEIRAQGGLAFIAHPFSYGFVRKHASFDFSKLKKLNGLETFNARNMFSWENDFAATIAKKLGLAQVGGSDAHFAYEIGRGLTLCEGDLRTALLKKRTAVTGKISPLPIARILSSFVKLLKK